MDFPDDVDPLESDTDLPLTQSVNGGNHAVPPDPCVEDAWSLLDEAAAPLPEPPIDLLDAEAVLAWIDRVNNRLLFREDRRRLAREAMRMLDREFRVAMDVQRLRQKLAHDEAGRSAREAGNYWARRDLRRAAQQPTHVEVSLDAWQAIRVRAAARGRTLGHEVGRLVVAEVAHPCNLPQLSYLMRGSPGRRANVFARLVVTKPTWQEFRALALERQVTVARYVGHLVERTHGATASPQER
jgi:hypothetical protein